LKRPNIGKKDEKAKNKGRHNDTDDGVLECGGELELEKGNLKCGRRDIETKIWPPTSCRCSAAQSLAISLTADFIPFV
jgi:hypothetical protein